MNDVFAFLGSQTGRMLRAFNGSVLILIGLYLALQNGITGGWALAAFGLLPLAAGVFDFCILAPLFGYPFNGPALRRRTSH